MDLQLNTRRVRYALIALAAAAALLVLVGAINRASAEGIAAKGKARSADTVTAPKHTWTGVYVGGFGTYATGTLGDSGPIDLSSTGPLAGVNVGVNLQTGQIVWGVEVAHAWAFGDLKDIGINRELEYTGRVGVLWNPQALLYVHGSFAQISTSFGDFEGWKGGVGVEIRTPSEGWSMDLRGGYADYDVHPSVEANMLWLRAGLVKRFDMPAGWFGQ